MTRILFIHRLLRGFLLAAVVLVHAAVLRWADGLSSPRQRPAAGVRWIEARRVVLPVRTAAAPTRSPGSPGAAAAPSPDGPAARVRQRRSAPVASATTTAVPPAAAVDAALAGPASEPAASPPLDLRLDHPGGVLDQARRRNDAVPAGALSPQRSWKGAARDEFATVRQSETVGASGSRVTRVEGPLGTYCVRSPPPGRPATPDLALPTRCP
ncbi:hypothetical protein GN316_09905 [Xylophilus sp. Kf1]|nr:hypothetical protein [Xylophilus sp. Kf1]